MARQLSLPIDGKAKTWFFLLGDARSCNWLAPFLSYHPRGEKILGCHGNQTQASLIHEPALHPTPGPCRCQLTLRKKSWWVKDDAKGENRANKHRATITLEGFFLWQKFPLHVLLALLWDIVSNTRGLTLPGCAALLWDNRLYGKLGHPFVDLHLCWG